MQTHQDPAVAEVRPSGNSTAQAHSNTQRVKSAGPIESSVGTVYGTFLSSITQEDIERFKKEAERLMTDDKARKELFTRIGVYDKDSNVTEPFRHLVEGSTCTPRT